MNNWLTIGQFSKKVGVSNKALRLYEKMGLLQSHTRGENGYRYFDLSQLAKAKRLQDFKKLGFTLAEIKSLLQADQDLDSNKMVLAMKSRLALIHDQLSHLSDQKTQIEKIMTSLNKKTEPLKAQQRRAIMSFYGQISIVVTGYQGLEKTAQFIQQQFQNSNCPIPILKWQGHHQTNLEKPYILIIEEKDLISGDFNKVHPDVIVIKGLRERSEETRNSYLKLYTQVGPHVNTVINADDRSAVELAEQTLLKKGRIFYFTKNGILKPQIENIGGVVSDGEEIEIFGFNLKPDVINLKLKEIMTQEDEMALLSSLGAVMTVGFDSSNLKTTQAKS